MAVAAPLPLKWASLDDFLTAFTLETHWQKIPKDPTCILKGGGPESVARRFTSQTTGENIVGRSLEVRSSDIAFASTDNFFAGSRPFLLLEADTVIHAADVMCLGEWWSWARARVRRREVELRWKRPSSHSIVMRVGRFNCLPVQQ